jgi:hypothetical protein
VATNGRATTFDCDAVKGAPQMDKPMTYLKEIRRFEKFAVIVLRIWQILHVR